VWQPHKIDNSVLFSGLALYLCIGLDGSDAA
jgi:hypothetical protein